MVFVTWINAIGTILSPPPEQVENPRKSMNSCCPFASRITLPFADDKISVYAEDNVVGAPEVVTQIPLDSKADVTEYAIDRLELALSITHTPYL